MRLVLSSVSKQALAPKRPVRAISDNKQGYSVRLFERDPILKHIEIIFIITSNSRFVKASYDY